MRTAGGVLGIGLGFGAGSAIEGRWTSEGGWVFTLGEAVALTAMIAGVVGTASASSNNGPPGDATALLIAGALGFSGLRLWEAIDAFVGPTAHNERLRALRQRLHQAGVVALPNGAGGGEVGFSFRF
jgi:hypothetical protein